MTEPIYVLFDHCADAVAANRALMDAAGIAPASEQTILRPPLPQGKIAWQDSRIAAGALAGAGTTGVVGAIFTALAASGGALDIAVAPASVAGAVIGAIYGIVLGAIAGSTEPKPRIRRLRAALAVGHAAIVATFDNEESAVEAEALLLGCRGARASI